MTLRLVFNPTSGPLNIDSEGHVLGGGEWGSAESTDPVTRQLLDRDRDPLIESDGVPDDVAPVDLNPAFLAAAADHDERLTRIEQARKLDKAVLLEALTDDPTVSSDVDSKTELVQAVAARDDVDIPRPSRRTRGTKES